MPQINRNIKGKKYRDLINYLCDKCEIFAFTISTYDYIELEDNQKNYKEFLKNIKRIMKILEEDLIVKKHTPLNFLQLEIEIDDDDYMDWEKEEYMYDICFFKISEKTKQILMEFSESLFDWEKPNLPEDLFFIKDDYIKFSYISHEHMGYMYCESIDEIKKLDFVFKTKYEEEKEEAYKKESKELLEKINANN